MSELRNDEARGRYEMDEEGMTSWANYRLQGGRLYIDHVESPVPLRGAGAAGRLMAALAEDARRRGLTITPICGYAAAWLRRSKDYRDLLSPAGPQGVAALSESASEEARRVPPDHGNKPSD
ncbi:MAG: GNAT family N-acetyltransferase [Phenylobacterium sp.]